MTTQNQNKNDQNKNRPGNEQVQQGGQMGHQQGDQKQGTSTQQQATGRDGVTRGPGAGNTDTRHEGDRASTAGQERDQEGRFAGEEETEDEKKQRGSSAHGTGRQPGNRSDDQGQSTGGGPGRTGGSNR